MSIADLCGCIPRVEGDFSKCFGDGHVKTYMDHGIEKLPRSEWQDFAGIPDEYAYHTFSQLSTMCSSNALAALMMGVRAVNGQSRTVLAPEDLFDAVGGRPGRGTSLGDNLNVVMNRGILTRATIPRKWPVRRPKGSATESEQNVIKEAIDLNGDWEMGVTALHLGLPLYGGLIWPGPRGGGHAIPIFNFRKSKMRTPNTWGKKRPWDELTERQCSAFKRFGLYAILVVSSGPADTQPVAPIK